MASSPIFSEMIDVELNSGPLMASLDALISGYKDKLEELNNSGLDASSMGGLNVSEFNAALESMQYELKSMTDAFMEAMSAMSSASDAAGNAITQSVGTALEEVDSKANESTKTVLENLSLVANGSEETWSTFAKAAQTALEDEFDPRVRMTGDLTNNLFKLMESGGKEAFDQLTAQQLDWYLSVKSTYERVASLKAGSGSGSTEDNQKAELAEEVALGNDILAITRRDAAEKKAAAAEAIASIRDERAEQVALGNDVLAITRRDAAEKKAAADAVQAAIREERANQVALGNDVLAITRRDAAEKKAAEDAAVASAKAQLAAQVALGNDISAITRRTAAEQKAAADAQQAAIREERTAQEKLGADIIAITRREAAERKANGAQGGANNPASESIDALSSFSKSFTEQFSGEMLGQLAGIAVAWKVIQTAIDLAKGAVEGFFDFFKTGVSYLADLEERTASLQGLLASNVTFSKDQATNFALAKDAAVQMNKEIQDYAIKYGLNIEVITRGFKSFVDNGGVTLTKGVDEALQASVLMAAAIKAAGKDAESTRSLLSEIPKLLDGTATTSSKILETLHISTAEWKAMTDEAKTQQNLLPQLQTRLKNYVDVAAQSVDRFGAMKEELGLIFDRTAGLAAQQFWPVLKQDLQDINKFLADNKTQIDACAVALGRLAEDFIKFASNKSVLDGLLASLKYFVVGLIEVKYAVAGVVRGFEELVAGIKLVFDSNPVNLGKGLDAYSKKLQEDVDKIKSIQDENHDSTANRKNDIDDVLHPMDPFSPLPGPQGAGANQPADNTKASKDALIELKAEYEKLFEANKKAGDVEKAQIADNLAARVISVAQASALTIAAADKEYQAQKELIELYKEKAGVIKAPAPAKASFIGSLDAKQGNLDDQATKAEAAQTLKAITDSMKVQDDALTAEEAAAKKSAAAQLEIIRSRVKAGTETVVKGLDDELAAMKAEHTAVSSILQQEVTQAGANADMKVKALAAISAEDSKYRADIVANSTARIRAVLDEGVAFDASVVKQMTAEYESSVAATEAGKRAGDTALQTAQSTLRLAEAYASLQRAALGMAVDELVFAKSHGVEGKELDTLVAKVEALKAARDKAQATVAKDAKAVVATDPIVPALENAFGDWKTLFDDFSLDSKGFAEDMRNFGNNLADTMNSSTAAITEASKIASGLMKAIQEGGAQGTAAGMGAAGGALSSLSEAAKDGGSLSKLVGDSMQGLFKNAGVVGSLLSAASGLVSALSSIFTAAAQRIADSIKKAFDATLSAYNNGSSTLAATIAAVEAERNQAIAQLSSQKGGQAQLDKLLPTLDAEIASLESQQKTIITNFETSLQKLQLHSDVLSQTLDTWTQINASVQQYIDAGGSAANAAAYLSESLEQMKLTAAQALSQGEEDAIAEAITYNNLLVQRQALTDAYNKSRFDTLNADALERRASNAVGVGLNQTAADAAYKTSLDALNAQIAQAATEVSMYKQIYQLASDTASLTAGASALQIQDLATQLQTLKDQATVYNSIYQKQDGTFGTNNGTGTGSTSTYTTHVGITVNVPYGSAASAQDIANTIQSELQRSGRYGTGTTFTKG